MIKITSNARLPIEICKGSAKKRLRLAKQLNKQFFNKLSKKFSAKDIELDVFEKTLKSTTAANIQFNVLPYKNYRGGLTEITANPQMNKVTGFNIYLPVNPFDGRLSLYNIETALHETFHFNFHISNPKHTARFAKMYESGLAAKTESFYGEKLYSKDKIFNTQSTAEALNNFLAGFTAYEQINFLQNSRYRLSGEIEAFAEGAKYLEMIQHIHSDKISEKISAQNITDYHFREKIKILTDKLKEIISKERENKNFLC